MAVFIKWGFIKKEWDWEIEVSEAIENRWKLFCVYTKSVRKRWIDKGLACHGGSSILEAKANG